MSSQNIDVYKTAVDEQYQGLRKQLDAMVARLGMDPKDPMSTSYLLNTMIQGDPNGLIPPSLREDAETLALNCMFMHTEVNIWVMCNFW